MEVIRLGATSGSVRDFRAGSSCQYVSQGQPSQPSSARDSLNTFLTLSWHFMFSSSYQLPHAFTAHLSSRAKYYSLHQLGSTLLELLCWYLSDWVYSPLQRQLTLRHTADPSSTCWSPELQTLLCRNALASPPPACSDAYVCQSWAVKDFTFVCWVSYGPFFQLAEHMPYRIPALLHTNCSPLCCHPHKLSKDTFHPSDKYV